MIGRNISTLLAIATVLATALAAAAWQTQSSQQSSTQASKSGSGQASGSATASASASGSKSAAANSSGGGQFGSYGKPTHAILFSPGANWEEGKPIMAQNLGEHMLYMQKLLQAGKLVYAGPWRDEPGALAIIRAKDDAEAQKIVALDPGVTIGVLRADLKAWIVHLDGASVAPIKGPGSR